MNAKRKKTLLLVEDEILIAMAQQNFLEQYGYKVLTVQTGEKAVSLFLENDTIDLVLMDIDLGPGMDGTQAAELILTQHKVPILFLSSNTEPEIVEKTEKITSLWICSEGLEHHRARRFHQNGIQAV